MTISWLWCLSRSTARDIAVSGTRRTPLTAESLLLAGVAVSATLACTALAGPPCPQSTITVDVVTDATPEQNSWEIRNQLTDELIAAEGPFDQPSTFLSFDVCVASPGCYVFTFFDSQGNGIGPGAGYEVFFNNVSAGFGFRNFGFESSVFDIGDDCPTGACCFFDGSCQDGLLISDCVSGGGAYQGNASLCSGVECPQPPTGACCVQGKCLDDQTQPACVAMGGAYQGSDTLCAGIECPIPCPDATITVDVVTDSAPEETTWELVALSSGTIVASGGPYGQPMTLFSEDICVSSTECYDFTLFDSGNNGITQGGGYQVLYNGVLVGVGFGNFGSQSSVLGIGDGCPTGACCLFSGDCVDDLSEGQCEGLNGTYQGDGSLCSGVNCPLPPTGACCFEDGSCTEALTQMECVSVQGGSWQGSDVTCAAAMCPQPCPDATITVDILTDAAPAETTWEVIEQGSGTVVGSGGPYPGQPFTLFSTDVCVSSTGCYDLIVFDAGGNGLTGGGGWEVFYNGVSVGFGFGNFGDSDEQLNIGDGCVLGACCLTTGDCLDNLTAEQCAGFGGAYQGDDSVCASVTCVASGACCFLDGSCEQLEQVACSTGGGIYEGDGTSCDPSPCPAAGACCLPSGACVLVTAIQCNQDGGNYQGDDSLCMDVECPQPCPEDTIAVLILTDGFPEETTWEITLQPTNEVVASGGPYTGMPNTLIETEVCVDADGCYDVTIFDSAGNGITPPGGYQIDFNGATVAAGPGNFGASLTIPDVGGGCPTGACCLPDGNCLEAVTDSQCSAASGTYVGNDILCANANCPQPPVAACCLPDGQCIDEDQFTCADMNGEYQGDGTACTTTSCPIPCPDATIKVLILTDAAPKQTTWEVREQGSGTVVGSGGPYAEPGTLFETDVCVSSTSCYDFTIFDSAGNGIFPGGYQVSYNGTIVGASGNFTGASAVVANIGDGCMGLAMGACCFSDQSCLQLTQPGCLLSAGSFQGDNTLCADNPCAAAPCDGDTNNDGVVDVTDLINVISTWGTDGQGPGFDADLNDDGTVDVTDLIEVISGWGDCM